MAGTLDPSVAHDPKLDRPIVVDTGFLAAVQLAAGSVHSQAMTLLAAHGELWAPDHLRAELLGLVDRWRIERGVTVDEARQVLRDAEALIANFVPTANLWDKALDLAAEHEIAADRALFVALAERQDTFMITFDEDLAERLPVRCKLPKQLLGEGV